VNNVLQFEINNLGRCFDHLLFGTGEPTVFLKLMFCFCLNIMLKRCFSVGCVGKSMGRKVAEGGRDGGGSQGGARPLLLHSREGSPPRQQRRHS
jgi:hypothetical protein